MTTLDDADRAQLAENYAEAVRLYRWSLLESPGSFAAYYGLACACASLREFGDAIENYRRALSLRPLALDLRVNLGEALFALGHVERSGAELSTGGRRAGPDGSSNGIAQPGLHRAGRSKPRQCSHSGNTARLGCRGSAAG